MAAATPISHPPLLALCDELLLHIFAFLDLPELLACSRVRIRPPRNQHNNPPTPTALPSCLNPPPNNHRRPPKTNPPPPPKDQPRPPHPRPRPHPAPAPPAARLAHALARAAAPPPAGLPAPPHFNHLPDAHALRRAPHLPLAHLHPPEPLPQQAPQRQRPRRVQYPARRVRGRRAESAARGH